jgi:hypothetical protein
MKKIIAITVLIISGTLTSTCYAKSLSVEAVVKDISCFGKQDGEIELVISGGKSPYVVEWNDGMNELKRGQLKNGTYSFQVKDAHGAYFASEVEIVNPAPLTVYFSQHSNCLTTELGDINISIEGGTPQAANFDARYSIQVQEVYNERRKMNETKLSVEDANMCRLSVPVSVVLIDPKESFEKRTKASSNPMAEVQIKRENNDRLVFGQLKK